MTTICLCSCEIHPTTRGGAGVFVHHAARELLRAGHTVLLLLDLGRGEFSRFDGTERAKWGGRDRCRAFLVEDLCADLRLGREEASTPAYVDSLRWAAALQALSTRERIDLVEFYDFTGPAYAALALRGFGRLSSPGVIAVRVHTPLDLIDSVGGTRYLDRNRWSMHALERGAFRLAEAVLVPSGTFYQESLRERYQIEPGRAVVSVPAMGEGLRGAGGDTGGSRASSTATCTVAFVGRMFQIKGADQFVQAGVELLRRHPNLDLTFDAIGSDSSESPLGDSYVAYLRSMIPGALRARFLFPGHVPREQLGKRLSRARFAVFPSRLESFGYAMHEAREFGIPLIVNDIPAARDFLTHEWDVLLYDGRTDSLVAAMERLLADDSLRERLSAGDAPREAPLGPFYGEPRVLRAGSAESPIAEATVVVLGCAETTTASLQRQTQRFKHVVCLHEAKPDDEETVWLLARPWHARDEDGRPITFAEIRTTDALVFLQKGDQPAPDWLALCKGALSANPALGFAGTWGSRDGRVVSSLLDIAPESWPFERGQSLTRVLLRTRPGRLLMDELDPAFGPLGDIARVWTAIESTGPGILLPESRIELAPDSHDPPDSNLVKFLLSRFASVFADRMGSYAGQMYDQLLAARAGVGADARDSSLEHKIAMADQLGGRTLLRLGWRKAFRRLRGQAPPT